MYDYSLSEIRPSDRRGMAELDALLKREGIRRDAHLDYTVGLYDYDGNLVATGSCWANTLRCLAVDSAHQGEGLLNRVATHLVTFQLQRGNAHLFLYTKSGTAAFFADIGFHEIANVDGLVVFMENRRDGFSSFLENLATTRRAGRSAALVMNCNPFTCGHRALVERAAAENDAAHLFVVSEDASFFPFADRYELIRAGVADLANVVLHRTESYLVSQAVFPSYFLREERDVIGAQARLDAALFVRIAESLGVTRRYVGEEPFSEVTNIYNEIMREKLPEAGIELVVVPRKEAGDVPISASRVRQLIHDGHMDEVRALVPQTTFDYFATDAGRETVRRIREADAVVHY